MIFENSSNCMESIINVLINGLQKKNFFVYGDTLDLSGVFLQNKKTRVTTLNEIKKSSLAVLCYENDISCEDVEWIRENKNQNNILVYSKAEVWERDLCQITNTVCDLNTFSNQTGKMYFFGPLFGYCGEYIIPDDFKVLAIMHVYNEADIVAKTIEYLLSQEVDIYLVDNWSDDGSYEIMEGYAKRFSNRIMIERFPADGKKEYYDWYHQLERTEQINRELDYNWFIHYDADEMRISPWPGTTLREFIYHVDSMGYNLIDNTVIDFKLTNCKQVDSIFMQDTWFDFGHRKGHFEQRKTWKKAKELEIKSSGGHMAVVDYPKAFPLKVLNRHYPLRTIEQAERKIFKDRVPRFQKEKQERGWHGHYDKIVNSLEYIEDSKELLLWDSETIKKYYIPLFLRIGIRCDFAEDNRVICNEYDVDLNTRVVLYGAGDLGKRVYQKLVSQTQVVLWVDKNYKLLECFHGETIKNPEEIAKTLYDKIVIAINNTEVVEEVIRYLVGLGVEQRSIIWEKILFANLKV